MKLEDLYRPVSRQFDISSPYGVMRTIKIDGKTTTRKHNGVDFKCPERSAVYAMMPGQIHEVGYENEKDPDQGYGYRIIQKGEWNDKIYWVFYAHLAWSIVHKNYFVIAGETIAISGNTGRSSGPHLHVSVRENNTGNYVDFSFKKNDKPNKGIC